jgi:hypothetical protein
MTWTCRKAHNFEMWVWRRMEKVSWEDEKMNEEVPTAVKCVVQAIVKQKKTWIGHVHVVWIYIYKIHINSPFNIY